MILSKLFDSVEHEAKPLLSAAAKWAENEGLTLVKEVEAEVKSEGLIPLFNNTLGKLIGFTIPPEATLAAEGIDLLTTALARNKAQAVSGTTLRASVLNQGVEQAVLLAKGAAGDTATAPATPAVKTAT